MEPEDVPALQKVGAVITLAAAVCLAFIAIDILRERRKAPPAEPADPGPAE